MKFVRGDRVRNRLSGRVGRVLDVGLYGVGRLVVEYEIRAERGPYDVDLYEAPFTQFTHEPEPE